MEKFSLALNEGTDVTNIAHIVNVTILIPEVNLECEVTKELASMKSLCETTGQNIFKEVKKQ